MKEYKQLTLDERYQIYGFLKAKFSKAQIARELGRERSTINREIYCNNTSGQYLPEKAHQKAKKRKSNAYKHKTLTVDMKKLIKEKLKIYWSPEQIYGYCKKHCISMISHEAIYQHIKKDKKNGGDLYKCLRHAKKRRKKYGSKEKRGQIKNRVSIDKRSEIVTQRVEVGHWEGDLIVGGASKKGVVITMVELLSGLLLTHYVESKNSKKVSDAIIAMMAPFAPFVKTITLDNGKEFAKHETFKNILNAEVYFAHPYSSWERGANENTNGLIRQYFPKKTNFKNVSPEEIAKVSAQINLRPRKRLGYDYPASVFDALIAKL